MTHEEKERQAEQPSAFDEVMAVIDLEWMLRLRKRFQKKDNMHMVKMMTVQIQTREAQEKAEHEEEKRRRKAAKK